MPSLTQRLSEQKLISPPSWLPVNVMYETVMGSQAYGVADEDSDFDVVGFCIPPKQLVFPHLSGEIPGFGKQLKRFEQFQEHHVLTDRNEYDLKIHSIVKFFQLAMLNNPDVIDSLFTSTECVLHATQVGVLVRENRRKFLHKGAWHRFKGYAYSQLAKMKGKNPEPGSKRSELREKFGFDVKFAYHVIRLLGEVEQILNEGDLDLRRNSEQLKAIRRGDLTEDEIIQMAAEKEKYLERCYEASSLPYGPDEAAIKQLLVHCLEEHYGSLEKCVANPDQAIAALREINDILHRNRSIL